MHKFMNKIECDLLFLCGKSIITDRKIYGFGTSRRY